MYFEKGIERYSHSFMFRWLNANSDVMSSGIEIFHDESSVLESILYIRKNGANYLKSLSISDVRKLLYEFISENFHIIASKVFGVRSNYSFDNLLTEETKCLFADALSESVLFKEPRELVLFPLSILSVEDTFVSDDFFISSPEKLFQQLSFSGLRKDDLRAKVFPPFSNWSVDKQPVISWLGIYASSTEVAKRKRETILGAIALLPHPKERYLFSGRKLVHGYCTLSTLIHEIPDSPSHTPALSENIIITKRDHSWLNELATKMKSETKIDKRFMRALEYQYSAWMQNSSRRFPTLFAALDAIFGDPNRATKAIIEAVQPIMIEVYDYDRLRLLMDLRNSVVHGGAPNVYESSKYQKYYETYFDDPTRNAELIVARCLQITIFDDSFQERPHTYADLFKEKTGNDI